MPKSYLKNVHYAYFLLAIVILIIALFSNFVTLHYFELGIASSDLDKTTSSLAFKSALAMMSASLICFSLSKIIVDKSIVVNLRLLGFGLWIFELAIMSCTQYFIFKRDAAPLEAAEQKEALYSQSIEEHRAIALAASENSKVQGRSKYTANRIHASEILKDSKAEASKADTARQKLADSLASKKVTFAGVLSPIALLILAIARSFFLSVISIRFFTLFGSMFRRGLDLQEEAKSGELPDGSDPKGKRPSLDKKEPTNKESLIVQNSPSSVAPASASLNEKYSKIQDHKWSGILVKKYEEKKVQKSQGPAPLDGMVDAPLKVSDGASKTLATSSIEGVSLKKKDHVPDTKKSASKKRASDNADTGTEKGKNLRYRALVSKIKGGIKPTIRNIRNHAECNQETAIKYREKMLKSGIIMIDSQGSYIIKPKLKAVK